jgi:hypothetical protein
MTVRTDLKARFFVWFAVDSAVVLGQNPAPTGFVAYALPGLVHVGWEMTLLLLAQLILEPVGGVTVKRMELSDLDHPFFAQVLRGIFAVAAIVIVEVASQARIRHAAD